MTRVILGVGKERESVKASKQQMEACSANPFGFPLGSFSLSCSSALQIFSPLYLTFEIKRSFHTAHMALQKGMSETGLALPHQNVRNSSYVVFYYTFLFIEKDSSKIGLPDQSLKNTQTLGLLKKEIEEICRKRFRTKEK